MDKTRWYEIWFHPDIFHPPILIKFEIPVECDPEEYIDKYLESILSDDVRYNAEWEFF